MGGRLRQFGQHRHRAGHIAHFQQCLHALAPRGARGGLRQCGPQGAPPRLVQVPAIEHVVGLRQRLVAEEPDPPRPIAQQRLRGGGKAVVVRNGRAHQRQEGRLPAWVIDPRDYRQDRPRSSSLSMNDFWSQPKTAN
jgi:hypothetical protein